MKKDGAKEERVITCLIAIVHGTKQLSLQRRLV
jgi:hypothetical protein